MTGSYHFSVYNNKIRYEFDINRNITIIKGNSATGKTTLLDILNKVLLEENSGFTVITDAKFVVFRNVYNQSWKDTFIRNKNHIVFIDEDYRFVHDKEFLSILQESGCYAVIVSRDPIESLPYSIKSVYGIRESSKYGGLAPIVNEFYELYDIDSIDLPKINRVCTEDKKAGKQFFYSVFENSSIIVDDAGGKSNIKNDLNKNDNTLYIVDGAAFGSNIEEFLYYKNESKRNSFIWAPESFEYLLLKSNIINIESIKDILNNPVNYIESSEYVSWERFFTALLIKCTTGTIYKYSKSELNEIYKQDKVKSKIVDSFNDKIKSFIKSNTYNNIYTKQDKNENTIVDKKSALDRLVDLASKEQR